MSYTISGNVVARNARLVLTSVKYGNGDSSQVTFSHASGNYTFSGVPPGHYRINIDLSECVTSPYNSGYSYRSPLGVEVIASNLVGVNSAPVLLNASNQ